MAHTREALHQRLVILAGFFYLCVFGLGLRLLQVQVIRNVYYARAAERNRTQLIRQTAPRGRIYDRNGEMMATNQPVFSLIYLPAKDRDGQYLPGLAKDLAAYLKQDTEDILENLNKAVREQSAIRLAEKLPPKVMFKLAELIPLYPGLLRIVEARRYYPNGAFAAHLLGHMGKMDEVSWNRLKKQGYRVDSWVGRAGIEKLFEQDLRGKDGGILMEVDARGRIQKKLDEIAFKAGSNLTLTIDSKLQLAAEDALRHSPSKQGAVVALDPRNGDVLALASIPDFDPNWFLVPESGEFAANLKEIPAFNLAIQGSFPPGSTFKIISSAAMLNEGRINPEEKVWCPGYFELGNHVFMCWIYTEHKEGHHWQNWLAGIAHSCDVYFYKMGLKAGGDLIEKYERVFHIGQRTRIDLPGESAGHSFGPEARAAQGRSWYDGDTVNLSIGQGELLVTPVQMAVVMAAVANRGILWRPHFIERIQYTDRPEYARQPEEVGRVALKDSTWKLLRQGLENVVTEGTGMQVRVPGVVIGGKTGTAQTGALHTNAKDQAWFVAYAGRPGEEPSLALAVLVQFGGHGAAAAVPVARQVIEAAFAPPAAPPTAPTPEQTLPLGAKPAALPIPVR